MNIQIKKYKRLALASQETDCFEAELYDGPTKIGTVSNEGHGGPHCYHFVSPEIKAQFEQAAKTKFPNHEIEADDAWVDEIIQDQEDKKIITKLHKKFPRVVKLSSGHYDYGDGISGYADVSFVGFQSPMTAAQLAKKYKAQHFEEV